MNVLITGGAGFLGTLLARELLARGTLPDSDHRDQQITRLTLVDIANPHKLDDPRVCTVLGSIADPELVERAMESDTQAIFHLASVVSGHAELDFDLGMRANFDATRLLLERARRIASTPRFLFASSVAVFGGALPPVVQDDTAPAPQSSYGTQKLMCELLITDYRRRGFVDGRALRLPIICVRPGAPNRAASSFASSIIREPLAGRNAICPVLPDTLLWLMSPGQAIKNLVHGYALDATALGSSPVVNLPGLSVTVRDMIAALERCAGRSTSAQIRWEPDPIIKRIVNTWPGQFATPRATAFGFRGDMSFDDIVRAHIAVSAVGP